MPPRPTGHAATAAPVTDAVLVARVLAGDNRHAFAELTKRHQSAVRTLLRRREYGVAMLLVLMIFGVSLKDSGFLSGENIHTAVRLLGQAVEFIEGIHECDPGAASVDD